MFFRKKRAAEKEARSAHRRDILTDIEERINALYYIKGSGEKLLKLKELDERIEKSSNDISSKAGGDVFGRGFGLGTCLLGLLAVGGAAVAMTFGFWAFAAVIIPGAVISCKVSSRSASRLETELAEENKSFFADMSEKAALVRNVSSAIIDNDWAQIAKSPQAEKIFEAIPRLRAKCATAFAKGAASGDIPVQDNRIEIPEVDAQSAVVLGKSIGVTHSLKFKKPK